MPRLIVESDEEPQAQEVDGHEGSNSTTQRRVQRPSTKQKEIGKKKSENTISSHC